MCNKIKPAAAALLMRTLRGFVTNGAEMGWGRVAVASTLTTNCPSVSLTNTTEQRCLPMLNGKNTISVFAVPLGSIETVFLSTKNAFSGASVHNKALYQTFTINFQSKHHSIKLCIYADRNCTNLAILQLLVALKPRRL